MSENDLAKIKNVGKWTKKCKNVGDFFGIKIYSYLKKMIV